MLDLATRMTMKPGTQLYWHHDSFVHLVVVVERSDDLPTFFENTVDVRFLPEDPLLDTRTVEETELFATEAEAYTAARAWLKSRTESVNLALELATKKAA